MGQQSSNQQSSKKSQSTREKAKQARLAAEVAQRRRERMIRFVGAGAVLAVVAAIVIGALVFSDKGSGGGGGGGQVNPNAALPNGVDSSTYAYQVLAKDNPSPPAGVATVQIWEDFQCPACKDFEDNYMPTVMEAAKAGTINLQLRPTTFLDQNFPQSNNTSARATSAWGCAVDAGKPLEYHDAVFQNQVKPEGNPIPQDKFIDIGKQIGIAGADFDKFSACVNASTYLDWSANSTKIFEDDGVQSTPSIYVNGKSLTMKGINNPPELMEKIKSLAG